MDITCLVVNRNCLFHTCNLIGDIEKQTYQKYHLCIVDNGSTEEGTHEKLEEWRAKKYEVISNATNVPLNYIWNETVHRASSEIIAFLNNDIRIPRNFLQDTYDIFEENKNVSCVIHPTNHPRFRRPESMLEYVILEEKTKQGWDFAFRKADWVDIPEDLQFYCGDDFAFESVYRRKKKVAMALSSPISHLLSQTNKIAARREGKAQIDSRKDVAIYESLGFSRHLKPLYEPYVQLIIS